MKAKINVGFSAKLQVSSYNPIEENTFIELEIDYDTPEDLEEKIKKWEKFVQNRVLNALKDGKERYKTALEVAKHA